MVLGLWVRAGWRGWFWVGGGNILILDLDGGSMVIKIYMCTLLHVVI